MLRLYSRWWFRSIFTATDSSKRVVRAVNRRAARLRVHGLEERVTPDTTPHNLAVSNFYQNWNNTTLVTVNDNWAGVPSVTGFLGDDTFGVGVDPQTVVTPYAIVDVIANQGSNTKLSAGGVAEFDGLANPVVALQGDATAEAPNLVVSINSIGRTNISISYTLLDIDGTVDNAVQPVALQYRIGNSGNFVNVPSGFVADATTGPNLATLVTPVNVTLPSAVENQAAVEIRIITTNASGNNEWVGIDDIVIGSTEFAINTYTTGSQFAGFGRTVAADADGDALVVWSSGQEGSNEGVYGQRFNSAGAKVGGEFPINTYTTFSQRAASVAVDADGDALVVWQSFGQDGNLFGIYGQRFNSAGAKVGGEFQVNTYTTSHQFNPAVAVDSDGDALVVWSSNGQDGSGYGIYGQRFNSAGAKVGGEFQVNTYTTGYQQSPAVAVDADGDAMVVWNSGQGGIGEDVYGQRFNSAGVKVGGEFPINTHTAHDQFGSSVAVDADGDAIVVWHSNIQDGSGYGVYGQRFNSAGTKVGVEFPINTHTTEFQLHPAVAVDADGDAVIVWESFGQDGSLYGIYGQRYNSTGTKVGVEFQINTYTTSDQRFPAVAVDADGDAVIVWNSLDQDSGGVFGQRFLSPNPNPVEFAINTYTTNNQSVPSVAMDADGDAFVVWESNGQDGSGTGIYGQRFNSAGAKVGVEFQIHTYTFFVQGDPSVAVDADGDAVVVWQSYNQDGSLYDIYGQRYNSAGAQVGVEFRINTYTTSYQLLPSVAVDADGDAVVVWQSTSQDGSSTGIYGQRFNSAGAKVGVEFRINTYTIGSQAAPSVAVDADGDAVVVWQSYQDGDTSYGIYGQRYNSAGAKVGVEFPINTYTTSTQAIPSVAMDADGDAVVVWESDGQDGSLYGVYGQRFDASGMYVGPEFQVNSYTTGHQFSGPVAVDADGDAFVTWISNGQDGSGYGIYGQRFNSAGVKVGAEFQINTYTTGHQTLTSVAVDADGDAAVVWSSQGQDGSGFGVYGQRFMSPNPIPKFSSIQINDGSAQRSMVTSLKIAFASPVSFAGNPTAAFSLVNQKTNNAAILSGVVDVSGTVVTLTFTGGSVDSGGSLSDGRYTLTILGGQFTGNGFDGNGDGIAGDNYVLFGDPTVAPKLFRLFGDSDGNGTVNGADFLAFRLAFLTNNPTFDFNNDGSVDGMDFLQFRLRFLISI